jgi:hypothetical protein
MTGLRRRLGGNFTRTAIGLPGNARTHGVDSLGGLHRAIVSAAGVIFADVIDDMRQVGGGRGRPPNSYQD